jgi:hypothetical protein
MSIFIASRNITTVREQANQYRVISLRAARTCRESPSMSKIPVHVGIATVFGTKESRVIQSEESR